MALTLTGAAFAGPSQDSATAYERGDNATAVKPMTPFAEQGDARAQHALGTMYTDDRGVPRDYTEVAKWLRLVTRERVESVCAVSVRPYGGVDEIRTAELRARSAAERTD